MGERFCGHAHTMYSNIRLIDCINKPKDLILKACELGLSGIALTDHETLGGHVQWLKAEQELKAEGKIPSDFKCALGNEIYLVKDRDNIEQYWHYILIAKNNQGHRALRELSSKAWLNGYTSRGLMRVPTEMRELEEIVHKYPNSLIATNACIGGYLGNRVIALAQNENNGITSNYQLKENIDDFIRWNLNLFGDDFYFEIAAGTSEKQLLFNQRVKSIVKCYGGKIVIGDDAHYLTYAERPIHKVYLNSKQGDREVDEFYSDAHLMSREEIFLNLKNIYSKQEIEEMFTNSLEMENKIEGYDLFHSPIIPQVDVKAYPPRQAFFEYPTIADLLSSTDIQERYWVNQCIEALQQKGKMTPEYMARLEKEAHIIKTIGTKLNNNMFSYFNTFQHYINMFWECGSIVGPGRGSSVCFLSNYLLGITQLDPVQWNLKEWRFLNESRTELPDIDIDLNPSVREKIFQEIRKERGDLNLLQVCTWGTEGTRSAIATACRGYRSDKYPSGISVGESTYLSNLVPNERGQLWSIEDCVYGNEKKDRQPIKQIIEELDKFDGLLDIIKAIEGLICKRGTHASGVMLYNNSPFETNAVMRSPNGDITTQFDLHDSEALGDTKFDFLVTEICDKITLCIQMLQEDGELDPSLSLRAIYEKYLHPEVINVEDSKMWDALANGDVIDVFQFSTNIGKSTAKQIKPVTPKELTSANALMRLMGEKGRERPIDRYCRLKQNMQEWYQEAREAGLTEEEIKMLEPYYLPNYGVPCAQEDFMEVCQDIAHFTMEETNYARKVVAKKKTNDIPALQEKFISQCSRRELGEYVWETVARPQMGYSFSIPHALSYSFVGLITLYLATHFPSVYWNCACLIINVGFNDSSPNYGKISEALCTMRSKNINILPPDINKSAFRFKPDAQNNAIYFGLKGIGGIGENAINTVVNCRPYASMDNFLEKTNMTTVAMFALIKAGAFDSMYETREQAVLDYAQKITPQKKSIGCASIPKLQEYKLLPENQDIYVRYFNFNKYLKKHECGEYYYLDGVSSPFYYQHFDEDAIELGQGKELILQKEWDRIYRCAMEDERVWLKENKEELISKMNSMDIAKTINKYAPGDINTWDMDTLGTYCHEHELKNLNQKMYDIIEFNSIPEHDIGGIFRICGTAINKDKNAHTVTLLTPNNTIVTVKMWASVFAMWDKQIVTHAKYDTVTLVKERSFFERGTKLMITGKRKGDMFMAQEKINWHPMFEKILRLSEEGLIQESVAQRAKGDEV